MDQLMYHKRLAEFDEKISFHKVKVEELEHEKSRFVLDVLNGLVYQGAVNGVIFASKAPKPDEVNFRTPSETGDKFPGLRVVKKVEFDVEFRHLNSSCSVQCWTSEGDAREQSHGLRRCGWRESRAQH